MLLSLLCVSLCYYNTVSRFMESKKYSFRYRVIARAFKDELIAVGINVDKIIQKDIHDDTITFTVRAWCCNDTQTKWFDIMAKRYFQHECGWYLQERETEQKCKELISITNRINNSI